jgi:hypothetical protein
MLTRISNALARAVRWWAIVAALLVMVFAMSNLLGLPANVSTKDFQPIDPMFFPSAETSYRIIASLDEPGRQAYRHSELVFDSLYIAAYTVFFSLLLSALLRRLASAESWIQKLNLLVFPAALFDLVENLSIVAMLSLHPAQPLWLGNALFLANGVKWAFGLGAYLATFLALLAFAAQVLRRAVSRQA